MTHATFEAPFADLDIRGDEWELTAQISIDRHTKDPFVPAVIGDYSIEAGCEHGRWRLRVQPITGYDEAGMVQQGAPLIDLRDQTTRPTPLEWLAGLMSGGMA